MSWSDKMKVQADVVSRDRQSADAHVMRSTNSASWDPHEVWVTRVKQPRERAASRVTTSVESRVLELPD
jgi:hypothetical protein